MAGFQVRVYETGRALVRRGHEVIVAAPFGKSGAPANDMLRVVEINEIGPSFKADLWITSLFLAPRFHARLRHLPMVIDGYESPFGSFLWSSASLLPKLGARVLYQYRAWIQDFLVALNRADAVLCANENQRVCYITLLCTLGKISPKFPCLDKVLTVCSGAPPEPPPRDLSGFPQLQAIRNRGPVVLWAGGCYPWFDAATYSRAMPRIAARVPNVTFLFAGIDGMDGTSAEASQQQGANELRAAIEAQPELKSRSVFVDWLPYRERGRLYAVADAGACTYGDHLETIFSMRTRVIDMVWGRLPVVTSAGDRVSAFVQENKAGIAVPPGDAAALAESVVSLLDDPVRRSEMAAKCEVLASSAMSWDTVVEPLHRFCLNPQKDPAADDPLIQETVATMIRVNDRFAWRLQHSWFRGLEHLRRRFSAGQNGSAANAGDQTSKTERAHGHNVRSEAAFRG